MRHLLILAVLLLSACPPAVVHKEVCAAYVACAKGLDVEAAARVETTFGDQSACWSSNHQALACVEGCAAGLEFLRENKVSCPAVVEVK